MREKTTTTTETKLVFTQDEVLKMITDTFPGHLEPGEEITYLLGYHKGYGEDSTWELTVTVTKQVLADE